MAERVSISTHELRLYQRAAIAISKLTGNVSSDAGRTGRDVREATRQCRLEYLTGCPECSIKAVSV